MVLPCRTTSLAFNLFIKIHSFTEIIQNCSLNTLKRFYWCPGVTTTSYHSFSLHIYFESFQILDVDATLSRCRLKRIAHRRVGAVLFKQKHPDITRTPAFVSFRLFFCFDKKNTHFNTRFRGRHADCRFKKCTRGIYIA